MRIFRFKVGGNRKTEANHHATRIPFNWRIKEFFHIGKFYDFIQFVVNLSPSHPEDGTGQINILASGKFRMKPGPNFQQRTYPPVQFNSPFRG